MGTDETGKSPVDRVSVLSAVAHEVIWLDTKWQTYQSVFSRSDADLASLNCRTAVLFRLFQVSLIDDIILTLSKLLDPKATTLRKRKQVPETRLNSTFSLLLDSLPAHVEEAKRQELQESRGYLEALCAGLVQHRNRRIAHSDLRTAAKDEELAKVPIATVNEAVAHAKGFVNAVSNAFDGMAIPFHFHTVKHEADQMIRIMRLGNEALDRDHAARGVSD